MTLSILFLLWGGGGVEQSEEVQKLFLSLPYGHIFINNKVVEKSGSMFRFKVKLQSSGLMCKKQKHSMYKFNVAD